jgi:hypothetical protein
MAMPPKLLLTKQRVGLLGVRGSVAVEEVA